MNDQGQIVGAYNSDPGCRSCRMRGFLWENGSLTELPTLGKTTYAHGISQSGYVTGYSDITIGKGRKLRTHRRAFLWRSDIGMIDLGTLSNGKNSVGEDIIDFPDNEDILCVVGWSDTGEEQLATLWTIDLSLL